MLSYSSTDKSTDSGSAESTQQQQSSVSGAPPVKYSIIIPLYNRPDEIKELLESLEQQALKDFEVLVIEDGSEVKAEAIVKSFSSSLNIRYFYKPNEGPGLTRNFGFANAAGNFFIIFDSDCIIPQQYLQVVDERLRQEQLDCFGGPDAAHPSFTPIQKAISHTMTSLFTTGGIRGKKTHYGKFHPRSFNMGISRAVYEATGGFSPMRYGEDIEFSLRIISKGYKTGLIPEAYVYHKRRTSFKQFFWQVYHSGAARINLNILFPGELKAVHAFPALFTFYLLFLFLLIFINWKIFLLFFSFLLFYLTLIFVESLGNYKSFKVSVLSMIAAIVQLTGYGTGFMVNLWRRVIRRKNL